MLLHPLPVYACGEGVLEYCCVYIMCHVCVMCIFCVSGGTLGRCAYVAYVYETFKYFSARVLVHSQSCMLYAYRLPCSSVAS